MRDIMRDAAIITVAKQVMTDSAWQSVETFIHSYADKEKDREELRATLSLFDLIRQRYEKDRWELEGRYVWYWANEDDE